MAVAYRSLRRLVYAETIAGPNKTLLRSYKILTVVGATFAYSFLAARNKGHIAETICPIKQTAVTVPEISSHET